jgi:PhnB protein
MQFHAYLFLSDGRCREAFTRYQEILGGELEIMTGADMPPDPDGPDMTDLVMHAALTVGDGMLLGSDDPTGDGGPMAGMAVHLTVSDADEAERIFSALAEDGQVTMPIAEVFWSPRFGMCVDAFGVPWMISA